MEHANQEIRDLAKSKNVPAWKIAGELGIMTSSYFNLLNSPLKQEKEEQIKSIIVELGKGVN